MSEIKALETLRTAARNMAKGRNLENHEECNLLLLIADEIEAEIAERFVELPVDAYCVPIRPDDLMACTAFDTNGFDGKEHVLAVGNGFWVDKDGCTHIPSETLHAKPRTLEDMLRDFTRKSVRVGMIGGIPADIELYADEDAIAECADEIRELLGVSE